jgi:hypothetical protein
LTTRVKIRLSADEWNTIKAAIKNGIAIPVDARKRYFKDTTTPYIDKQDSWQKRKAK